MTPPRISMIWAQSVEGVIGREGTMPWHLPEDMAHFKAATTGHPVVMGRNTWDSIPPRFRPFAGRTNIVLTSHEDTARQVREAGGVVVPSIDEALAAGAAADGGEHVWVVGGGQVYAAFAPLAADAVVTVINHRYDGDTRAPRLGAGWARTRSEPAPSADAAWATAGNGLEYRFDYWRRDGAERTA
ncbi:dihydrofolate reductase [Zhihengliuella salsuginis]|uniref:Dihydrofolate reductase n=1 Tax=Zhihengliuella salsuginis TaxID=578222 RepID=A0ABQ3GM55_9MICC|nr:dihydrofolate reductase [Zhihengliuella salsuginis]GHD13513.1 dihydrofolate reductase [Zhihengliuella salsuginis]